MRHLVSVIEHFAFYLRIYRRQSLCDRPRESFVRRSLSVCPNVISLIDKLYGSDIASRVGSLVAADRVQCAVTNNVSLFLRIVSKVLNSGSRYLCRSGRNSIFDAYRVCLVVGYGRMEFCGKRIYAYVADLLSCTRNGYRKSKRAFGKHSRRSGKVLSKLVCSNFAFIGLGDFALVCRNGNCLLKNHYLDRGNSVARVAVSKRNYSYGVSTCIYGSCSRPFVFALERILYFVVAFARRCFGKSCAVCETVILYVCRVRNEYAFERSSNYLESCSIDIGIVTLVKSVNDNRNAERISRILRVAVFVGIAGVGIVYGDCVIVSSRTYLDLCARSSSHCSHNGTYIEILGGGSVDYGEFAEGYLERIGLDYHLRSSYAVLCKDVVFGRKLSRNIYASRIYSVSFILENDAVVEEKLTYGNVEFRTLLFAVEYKIAGHYDFALYRHLFNRPFVVDIVGITRRPFIVDGIVERDNGGIGLSLDAGISADRIMLAVENSKRLRLTVVYKVLTFVHVGSRNFDFGYRNRKVNALAARRVGIRKGYIGSIYSKLAYARAAALGNNLARTVGIICRDNHTFCVESFEYRIRRLVRKRRNLYSLENNAYYVVDIYGSGKAVVADCNTAGTRRERAAEGILLLRKNACYASVVVDRLDRKELFERIQRSRSIYGVFACRVLSRNGSYFYLFNIDGNGTFSGGIVGSIFRRERPVVGRGAVNEYTFYPRDSTGSISFACRDSGHSVTVKVVAASAATFNNGSYLRLCLVDSPREIQRLALTRIPLIVFGIVERYGRGVRTCRRTLVARNGVSGIGSYNVCELTAVVRKDLRLGYRYGNLLFYKLVSKRSGRSCIVAASVVEAHSNGISTRVENLRILTAYANRNRQRIALYVIGNNEVFGDFAARNYVSVVHTRSRALSSLYGNF